MATYPLYGGQVLLEFNEKAHSYMVNGKKILSVTQVSAPKPALVYWAAKEASDHFRRSLTPGRGYDEIEIAELCEAAKKAHIDKSSRAASIGTIAHKACELYAKGEPHDPPVNEQARYAYEQFVKWMKEHEVRVYQSEAKVYSRTHEYAGTSDLFAQVEGVDCVVDIKTSASIYDDYVIQLAAYAQAKNEELSEDKYQTGYIVRIPKDGSDFEVRAVERPELSGAFTAFVGLLAYHKWKGE